ncbi:MAG: hypothetical protein B6I36_02315 [Desulfobacteraceae bacterium 4572_35.1]|nr:MAG: hypothetical protein B6I36_02315 [Desulfobacteraceae bacterium 4572_35.1]
MARDRKLKVGILNFKIQPHTHKKYADLMQEINDSNRIVKIHGSDSGTIYSLNQIDEKDPTNGFYGRIYRFMEIHKGQPWFDAANRKPIVDKKGNPIPQVAGEKKPNLKEYEFVFYPNGHRLFFDLRLFSPAVGKKFFDRLFSCEEIVKKYGKVDVEIESSTEVIDRILKIPALTNLQISFTRPNSDDIGDLEADVLERMEEQHIRKFNQTLASPREDGVVPDAETIALMNVAISNGRVDARGYSGDEQVIESTDPHPRTEQFSYNPDKTTALNALISHSASILSKLTSRRQ